MNRRYSFYSILGIVGAAFLFTGCPPKNKMPIEERPKEDAQTEPSAVPNESPAANDVQITQDWAEIPALEGIGFDYDSAGLNDRARAILKSNVAILKKLPNSVSFRVEGHCDDRGTVEYNIALGQRRATTVSNFYATAGIPRSRLKTISYGEERPICTEQNESCWSRNRRSVTTVRNEQPITVNPDTLK